MIWLQDLVPWKLGPCSFQPSLISSKFQWTDAKPAARTRSWPSTWQLQRRHMLQSMWRAAQWWNCRRMQWCSAGFRTSQPSGAPNLNSENIIDFQRFELPCGAGHDTRFFLVHFWPSLTSHPRIVTPISGTVAEVPEALGEAWTEFHRVHFVISR